MEKKGLKKTVLNLNYTMFLRRLGNKKKIAHKIINKFPNHKIYIDLFFGAGGLFFNKPPAKINYLNDLDSEIFNIFNVLTKKKDEFVELVLKLPNSLDLFNFWRKNKETSDLMQALRFLFLSNYSLYGQGRSLRYGSNYSKESILSSIEITYKFLINNHGSIFFMNYDYSKVLSKISFKRNEKKQTFIYADPPYISTDKVYNNKFSIEDHKNLTDYLISTKIPFAISEFDNDEIIENAKSKNLFVTDIGLRSNIKNKRTEILITNYRINQLSLF